MNGRQESRHQLVLALDRFSNSLMGNLQWFIKADDISGAETIWTCCITCLGHLAALCHLTGQTEPILRRPMDDLCDLTLAKLANLSHQVYIEEHSHLDVLTGVRVLVFCSGRGRH